jgi:hypothetical protein
VTGGVAAPARELADSARGYLLAGKSLGTVKSVLHPIAALHEAAGNPKPETRWSTLTHVFRQPDNPEEAKRELIGKVEEYLATSQPASDPDRSQFSVLVRFRTE